MALAKKLIHIVLIERFLSMFGSCWPNVQYQTQSFYPRSSTACDMPSRYVRLQTVLTSPTNASSCSLFDSAQNSLSLRVVQRTSNSLTQAMPPLQANQVFVAILHFMDAQCQSATPTLMELVQSDVCMQWPSLSRPVSYVFASCAIVNTTCRHDYFEDGGCQQNTLDQSLLMRRLPDAIPMGVCSGQGSPLMGGGGSIMYKTIQTDANGRSLTPLSSLLSPSSSNIVDPFSFSVHRRRFFSSADQCASSNSLAMELWLGPAGCGSSNVQAQFTCANAFPSWQLSTPSAQQLQQLFVSYSCETASSAFSNSITASRTSSDFWSSNVDQQANRYLRIRRFTSQDCQPDSQVYILLIDYDLLASKSLCMDHRSYALDPQQPGSIVLRSYESSRWWETCEEPYQLEWKVPAARLGQCQSSATIFPGPVIIDIWSSSGPSPSVTPTNSTPGEGSTSSFNQALIIGLISTGTVLAVVVSAMGILLVRRRMGGHRSHVLKMSSSETMLNETNSTASKPSGRKNRPKQFVADLEEKQRLESVLNCTIPPSLELRSAQDYKQTKKCGRATTCHLWMGELLQPELIERYGSQTCLVKQIVQPKRAEDYSAIQFWQEVLIMWQLRAHPSICKLIGYSSQPAVLIMKFYGKGTLETWLMQRQTSGTTTSTRSKLQLALQIAHGLKALHRLGIAHGDLRPANIYLSSSSSGSGKKQQQKNTAVLGDFGTAQFVQYPNLVSSPNQTNSEAISHQTVSLAGDVLAFSMILYEVLTERALWTVTEDTIASTIVGEQTEEEDVVDELREEFELSV